MLVAWKDHWKSRVPKATANDGGDPSSAQHAPGCSRCTWSRIESSSASKTRVGVGRVEYFLSKMSLALHLNAHYGVLSERKLDTYRQTAKTQEKVFVSVLGTPRRGFHEHAFEVISKLEKILESSLQEAPSVLQVLQLRRLCSEGAESAEGAGGTLAGFRRVATAWFSTIFSHGSSSLGRSSRITWSPNPNTGSSASTSDENQHDGAQHLALGGMLNLF